MPERSARHPGFHATDTVDYAVCLEGEILGGARRGRDTDAARRRADSARHLPRLVESERPCLPDAVHPHRR